MLVLIVGMVALAAVTQDALRDSREVSMPSAGAVLLALVLTRLALACSARAWVLLLGQSSDARRVTGALYSSQLVKYLPIGGLVQAAGQIGLTATPGLPLQRVSIAFVTHAASSVAAGLTIGAGLVLVGDLPTPVRGAALLGLAGPALMDRRVLAAVLRQLRRLTTRVPPPDTLPDQSALLGALRWSAANLLLYSAGFAILLRSVSPEVPVASATVGYVVAWVLGFLVLPLPSGVGVREAALVALVPGVTAGPLLAASLAQRLVSIAVEVTAALMNRAARTYRR